MRAERWYPGHMVKARRTVRENLQNVDVVIEVLDARLPRSSRNPDIDEVLKGKPHVVVLNKKDLADDRVTQQWVRFFEENGIPAAAVSASKKQGIKELLQLLKQAAAGRYEKMAARKRKPGALRIMIVGIPNVGKSKLINALALKNVTRTGDKPGVTRGKQWIHIDDQLLLLDTPGILWPQHKDPEVQLKLDLIAAIDTKSIDPESTVEILLGYLSHEELKQVCRYLTISENLENPAQVIEEVARVRGFLMTGGKADRSKAATHILRAFQTGKAGRYTLEKPDELTAEDREALGDEHEI